MTPPTATSEIQSKKQDDAIKGITFDLRVPDEITDKYFTLDAEGDGYQKPEVEKLDQMLQNIAADSGIPVRLLRYGVIANDIPELRAEDYAKYGFEKWEDFTNIVYYVLHNKLEIGIVAGKGVIMVRVPFTLNPLGRLAEYRREGQTKSALMVNSVLDDTLVISDVHKNAIFVIKYNGKLDLPSRTLKGGIEILTSGEVVKPTECLVSKPAFEFEDIEDAKMFHSQDGYMLRLETLFKGKVDDELRVLNMCANEIFTYKDESGTSLAVIGNRAYDISSEYVRSKLFELYYDKTTIPPSTSNLKRAMEIMRMLTGRYGLTIENAPFMREIAVVEKNKEFAQQFAELLKMMSERQKVSMMELEEATGINGRVIGRRLKEPDVKAMISQLTGLGYTVTRDKMSNNSVIEFEQVGGTWQAISNT